jgi:hypothetical protein
MRVFSIVQLPLRPIERSRGWRRFVLLVFYGLIVLCGSAILWRRSDLAELPDVGYQFVGAALRSPAPVADDRNAFVANRRTVERFRDMNDDEGNSFSNSDFAWPDRVDTHCNPRAGPQIWQARSSSIRPTEKPLAAQCP